MTGANTQLTGGPAANFYPVASPVVSATGSLVTHVRALEGATIEEATTGDSQVGVINLDLHPELLGL